jgi:endonuclease G
VAFSSTRRIPIFTAVNIDGENAKKIKRKDDKWFADLRLPRDIQLNQKDYAHPDIDRGHMVRREDPNWGTLNLAQVANDDTFHYTNAAPQHSKLNQGKTQWLGLEEYVLTNAKTHGLLISVFTGPVLRDNDPSLENGIQVPEEFWKVVVTIDEEARKLRSTGYVLSQGTLIGDITEAFVFGQYRTYQVPVATIATSTGLDFKGLVAADALRRRPLPEAVPGKPPVIPLDRLENMVL